MADPLSLLREFTISKKPVILENDIFKFESATYPRSVVTTFRSKRGEGPPYSLDAVWFMLQHADKKYTEYLAECRKYKFPSVSLIDKKELVSYLNGEIATCASISALPTLPMELEPHELPPPEDAIERASKKQKTDIQDISLNEDMQKEKDEMAAKLAAPKLKSTTKEKASATTATGKVELDPKLIESLREKKRRKDRTTIKDDSAAVSQKTQSKYLELDAVVTKEIIARERLLVTRASVLQTRNKKAFSGIMDAAMASLKKDEQRKREEQQKKAAQNKAQHSYDRYGEVAEDKFWKDRLKGNEQDEWQIDTRGTFADKGRMPDVSQIPKEVTKKPPKGKPVAPAPPITETLKNGN